MPTSRGRSDVKRYMAQIPGAIEKKVLRGAARAGGKVIIEEAKSRSNSTEVSDALQMRVSSEPGRIVVKIGVKAGWARSLGIWQEYGTDPHFISVDDSQRKGLSVKQVNKRTKEGSLVIGGQFVGTTVHHPGARRHPFLRVSLDVKQGEAIETAQSYINARITPAGIVGPDDVEGEAE